MIKTKKAKNINKNTDTRKTEENKLKKKGFYKRAENCYYNSDTMYLITHNIAPNGKDLWVYKKIMNCKKEPIVATSLEELISKVEQNEK